jgi:hypothetical protein
MRIRPYILYGETTLGNIKAAVRQILREWSDAWGLSGSSLTMLEPVTEFAEGEGSECVLAYETGDDKWVLFVQDRELFEETGSLLLHDNRIRPRQGSFKDSVAADIVMQALAELACRLSGRNPDERISPVETTVRQRLAPMASLTGAGILRLQIHIADSTMQAWIPAQLAQSLAATDAVMVDQDGGLDPLFPVGKALSRQAVPVSVTLGNIELTLDAFCSLQEGDVIRLDEGLSERALVAFAHSETACKGFLGQKNGNLAVQIDSLIEI